MKKILLALVIACSFVACDDSKTTSTTENKTDSVVDAKKDAIDSTAEVKKDAIDSTADAKKDAIDSTVKK